MNILLKYIRYRFSAKTKYDVHSPFVFAFITEIMDDTRHFSVFDEIENTREELLKKQETIHITDFGAGSHHSKTSDRRIRDIAKHSLIKPHDGQLLFRIVDHYQCRNILEMGTSLGISTLYLAKASASAKIITLEGSEAIASVAAQNFEKNHVANIDLRIGEFSQTLPAALRDLQTVDLVFIDGNHRKEPTVSYFEKCLPYTNENSILIFDDIHWSDEMEQAWKIICSHPAVTLSIDLFFKGIVFFRTGFHDKQHYILKF